MSVSVDKVTQKSVKLDPGSYDWLTETKKTLEKYLMRNVSYGDAVRWLCFNSDNALSELDSHSRQMETQLSYAKGTTDHRPYAIRARDVEQAEARNRAKAKAS
jgi:hypothetical protein